MFIGEVEEVGTIEPLVIPEVVPEEPTVERDEPVLAPADTA